ncbi:MFS transporter [Vogesella sp. GCM10023246]|uniref:MFS transporter n=1 Tax=Vogesella oryzagri TaxID=3160864 RepID=A0ABV1M351_9NEIS
MSPPPSTARAANVAAAAPRLALLGLSLPLLLSSLATSSANIALPTLAVAWQASFQQVQWVVIGYLLAITSLIVSVGRLGDLLGSRRLLLGGIALFSLASLLCALAPTLPLLIAARVLQGLGAAVMMALTLAFVGELVPKEKTGSVMGLLGTTSAVGTALGPSLGGVLIAALGWRAIFLLNVPLGGLALWLAWRHLPQVGRKPVRQWRDFDIAGTLLLAAALAAYALALTLGRGQFGSRNLALLAAALLGGGLFVYTEARVTSPLLQLRLFRQPVLRSSLASSLLVSTVLMATLVVGPFYLAQALGLATGTVGMVVAVGPLVAALSGVPAGRLVDRLGAARMVLLALAAIALACGLLAVLPLRFGVAGYLLPMALLTAGYALFQTANNTQAMAAIDVAQRGLMSGMLNLARNLGLISGAALMGAVFAASGGGSTASPALVAHGLHTTFAVALALIALAWLLSAAVRLRQPGLAAAAADGQQP